MIRTGTPENVVMKQLGHETRSMLDRYDIVDDRDLDEAAKRQDDYQRTLEERGAGTQTGTSVENCEESELEKQRLH